MKLCFRYLITLTAVLTSVFVHGQDKPDVIKDLDKKTLGIASAYKFSDDLGIYQVNLNDTTFELIALDNKMHIQWRNQFKGYGVGCGKFKGNILAIADSGFSARHWYVNPYYAYSIDPQTGKAILQKEIFSQNAKHEEIATPMFTIDGSGFNLIVRQTNRRLTMFANFKDNTEDVTIIDLNENLEPVYIKPKFPDETFISMTANRQGDLFVLTNKNDTALALRHYLHGATEPSAPLFIKCDSIANLDLIRAYNSVTASEEDMNVAYLAIAHNNHNNDRELFVGKFDFSTKTTKFTTQVFMSKDVRAIEKNYVPANDQFPRTDLGGQKKQLTVKYFREHNGKLITVLAESYSTTVYNIVTYHEGASIINCYNPDLEKQFQQIMPVDRSSSEELTSGYRFEENALKIVANTSERDEHPLYGELDPVTGKWLNLKQLEADGGYNSDEHIIWFKDTFIVPATRKVFIGYKHNIDLHLYSY